MRIFNLPREIGEGINMIVDVLLNGVEILEKSDTQEKKWRRDDGIMEWWNDGMTVDDWSA